MHSGMHKRHQLLQENTMPNPKSKPAARKAEQPKRKSKPARSSRKPEIHPVESAMASIESKAEPVPDWVNATPDDNEYTLLMWDSGGDSVQQVEITRGEFITVKRWLAALRGYYLTAPMNEWDSHFLKDLTETERSAKVLGITQEEIQMMLGLEKVADTLALNARRRLQRGATVEPGEWTVCHHGSTDIEKYEKEQLAGGSRCGLEIVPVEEARAHSLTA
jgi:hypothetical protein